MTRRISELRPGRDVGAMINSDRFARLEELIQLAVQQGARLLVGGQRYVHPEYPEACYFQPTFLADVTSDMAIANQECFAPIMLAFKAKVRYTSRSYISE